MPRPKVDPRFRRRVAQACENCKKRKSKCNGILPCDHCRARGVEDACRYSRYPRPASQESQLSRGLPNREARREPGPLDPASPASSSKQIDIPVSNLYSVSKDSQMLKDSRGKFSMFSGPNASESKRFIVADVDCSLRRGFSVSILSGVGKKHVTGCCRAVPLYQ